MKGVLTLAIGLTLLGASAMQGQSAQTRSPIIDMHMHALPRDYHGSPPPPMCRDRLPWEWLDPKAPPSAAQPPCPSGFIEVPATDEDMILQTVALMEKYNMTGVLSAATRGGANPAERLDRLQKAAPGRFIPAV